MRRRLLAIGIALVLTTGVAGAAVRHTEQRQTVAIVGGDHPGTDTRSAATEPVTTDAPTTSTPSTSSTSSTTATAVTPGSPVAPRPSTHTTSNGVKRSTASSSPSPTAASVDQAGTYVIRRDGSGLRRVLDVCSNDSIPQWLNATDVAINSPAAGGGLRRVSVDGRIAPLVLPPAVRGEESIPLQTIGSVSSDGHRSITAFQGYAYGVAIVDLAVPSTTVLFWGDNPTPLWSPTGDILLVGPTTTKLVGPTGATIRDWAPSPIAPFQMMAGMTWSPDGRFVLGASRTDMNRWIIMDPVANTARSVPQVGTGFDRVSWAGPHRLLIADPGVDHSVPASAAVWDLATGHVTQIAAKAFRPTAPVDGQVAAFEDLGDHDQLGIVNIDGTHRADLVRLPTTLYPYPESWSTDGTWLLFSACSTARTPSGLPTT